MARILITGITGFVGGALKDELRAVGHDVYGLSRSENPDPFILQANLTDNDSLAGVFSSLPELDGIIHGASAANSHVDMDANYLAESRLYSRAFFALAAQKLGQTGLFIHLSSISIYGEAGRLEPVSVDTELRPAGIYGRLKRETEEVLTASPLKNYRVLRLGPVFNESRMRNVKVRVTLPGTSFKIKLLPAPRHSLCHTRTLARQIATFFTTKTTGRSIQNMNDDVPYSQHDLLSHFPGPALPLPRFFLRPAYWVMYLLGPFGYKLRCFYWKLFEDNIYD